MDDHETGAGSARARLRRSLVLGILQGLTEASQRPPAATPLRAGDVVLGLGAVAVDASREVTERVGLVVRPLTALFPPPTVVTRGPTRLLRGLAARGREGREDATMRIEALVQRVAPVMVERALGLVDVTDLVHDHVDLDTLVADVDVDAVAARLDLDAVLDRVDVNAIAARLDLDAVLDRVDVNAIAARLDADAVAATIDLDAILDRVDVNAIAARLDADAVAATIDLDAILDRVDVNAIAGRLDADAVAATIDLDALVSRLDLIALAEFVVEGIDLPGIIQSSTGSMASVAAREVRWQGIGADERVEHIVDRMLRRKERHPGAPSGQGTSWGQPPAPEPAPASSAGDDQSGPVPPPGDYGLAR